MAQSYLCLHLEQLEPSTPLPLAVLPANHPLAGNDGLAWDDLTGETFLVRHGGAGPDRVARIDLQAAHAPCPTGNLPRKTPVLNGPVSGDQSMASRNKMASLIVTRIDGPQI